jgi:hypothetical protein
MWTAADDQSSRLSGNHRHRYVSTKSKIFIDAYLFPSRRSILIAAYDETSVRSATRYRGNCNGSNKSQDLVLHKVEE